jgi:uncharacterized metal-binding protein YceD (DUF177 family)
MTMQPEFSFPVEVQSLPPSGRVYTITADADARARVAVRLGLRALDKLTAQLEILPHSTGATVTGYVEADVVQNCVVTLGPVPAHLREDVAIKFVAPQDIKRRPDDDEEEEIIDIDEEPPEVILDGRIDLGEVAVSQVALGLDPYPRAPGASFDPAKWGVEGEKALPASPFAALAKLKQPRPK